VILVDSSLLIKALGRKDSPAAQALSEVIARGMPYAICPYVYQEVLQGTSDELMFQRVKKYLDTQECLWLPPSLETYERAARIYWSLRRQGITMRGTINVLIACTAIHHGAHLMHDDRDFDQMATVLPDLKLLQWKS